MTQPRYQELIRADHLTKIYSNGSEPVAAVADVSMELSRSESVALMGPSGCGKSTLLDLVGLILVPTSGTLTIGGAVAPVPDRERARLRNQTFGYVPQGLAVIAGQTARSNTAIPLEYAHPRVGRSERARRAKAALEQVGLPGLANRNVERLSTGQQQRVAIARALVNSAPVILADEPTASLDDSSADTVIDCLLEARQQGAAVLIATHDPRVSERCDRIVVMRDGHIE